MENKFGSQRPKSQHEKNQDHGSKVGLQTLNDSDTHAVFVEKVLAVTPSTALDACIGFIRDAVALLAG